MHNMAGFAKGTATTSGWTLVLCDYRNQIHQLLLDVTAANCSWRLRRTRQYNGTFFSVYECSDARDCQAPNESKGGHGPTGAPSASKL